VYWKEAKICLAHPGKQDTNLWLHPTG
jgi:hypothetical protein